MKNYRKLLVLLMLAVPALLHAQSGPQLYNMGFDDWNKSGGVWRIYSKDAPG